MSSKHYKFVELFSFQFENYFLLIQSLKSRNLVKEQFAWRHYYWYLNNEGTNFLREYLNLPPEIVPATLKRPTRPEGAKTAKRGMSNKC
jgi:hypothetical protein